MVTIAYTDGACLGNPGPGGWAWAVPDGPFASGAEGRSTNQRMEIRAALEALTTLDGDVEIVSDSTYVVNCFRDRWWEGWLARNWLNKAKQPVANRDLWEPLIELYRARGGGQSIRFRWVKGHSGDAMNDVVDRLAVEAATTQTGRSGDRTPGAGELGPADAPATAKPKPAAGSTPTAERTAGGDPDPPVGHRVVVAGHKPPELGGYGETLQGADVRRRLAEILAAKRELHPDLVVLTGLGLGAEQLGAEAAAEAGVPYVAVLAFPGQDSRWPADSKRRYVSLLRGAASQVLLQSDVPRSTPRMAAAFTRRDGWLARHAQEAVVVWDGADALVERTVAKLREAVGEDDVWIVTP